MTEKIPIGFARAKKQAEELISWKDKMIDLLREASDKAQRNRKRLQRVWEELQWLFKLVRAYVLGEYRKIPWKAIIFAIAAILYFLNPFDVIPDFLPGIGLLDDATVIAFVVNAIREEIEKFKSQQADAHVSQTENLPFSIR